MFFHFTFSVEFVGVIGWIALLMLTFTPGSSRNWPSVTTVSPAFKPLWTTVLP
jgi:hypothetical protein